MRCLARLKLLVGDVATLRSWKVSYHPILCTIPPVLFVLLCTQSLTKILAVPLHTHQVVPTACQQDPDTMSKHTRINSNVKRSSTEEWFPKSPDGAYTGEKVPFPTRRRGLSFSTIVLLVLMVLAAGLIVWKHEQAINLATENYQKYTGQDLKQTDFYKVIEKAQKWKRSEL